MTKKIDYPSVIIKNNRELCYNNENKTACNTNAHCNWSNSKNICVLSMNQYLLVDCINKVAEEFIQDELKAHEILRKGEYFVSDIVDYNVFTERPGEKIVMSSNTNINKILSEIFGKENIPKIGKRRSKLETMQNYEQLNLENPLRKIKTDYVQTIIENNNTIFRAFANAYFWLLHPYNDISYRNLGYYSNLQTSLANYYKSQVVDWLNNKENEEELKKLMPYIKYGKVFDFTVKLNIDVATLTNCLIELYVLSKLYETIVQVSDENKIIYVIHPSDGIVYDHAKSKDSFKSDTYASQVKKTINLKFYYISKNIYPDKIEVWSRADHKSTKATV